MPTIKYKPTTNGRRGMTVPTFEELTKFTPEKSLVVIKKKNSGRNSYGRITVRHKGGARRKVLRRSSALSMTRTEPLTSRFSNMRMARRATLWLP